METLHLVECFVYGIMWPCFDALGWQIMLLTAFSNCWCEYVCLYASCYSMCLLLVYPCCVFILTYIILLRNFSFPFKKKICYSIVNFLLSWWQCPSFQWARVGASKSCQILCLCDSLSVSPYWDLFHGCYPDN